MITVNLTEEQVKLIEDASALLYVHGIFTQEQSMILWKTFFDARIEHQVSEYMKERTA